MSVLTEIPYREYVLKECERQWAECQEQDGHGPWVAQTEKQQKAYFNDMYQHLWGCRKELDAVILPEQPERDAWQKLKLHGSIMEETTVGGSEMEEKKKFEIVATIKAVLTQEDIDDIMVSALEGGINYWCSEAEVVEDKRCADWGHEQIARGGALILHDAESSDKWELTLEKFLTGFKLWLENNGDRYGAVDCEKVDTAGIDGEMADMIVQYAVFGQLMFG